MSYNYSPNKSYKSQQSRKCVKCGKTFSTSFKGSNPKCPQCFRSKSHRNQTKNRNGKFNRFKITQYQTEEGEIKPKLISHEPNYKNNVKDLAKALSKTSLTTRQLRRFYDEVLGYRELEEFDKIRNNLSLLLAKAAYSVGRGSIPEFFYAFLQNRIQYINDDTDFKYFLMHFQALVGYFKYLNPK